MRNDAARVGHVLLELADQVVGRGELDVGMQVARKRELESLLVQVAFEIEQERLDSQLRAAEGGPVPNRKGGHELALREARAPGIRAQRRHQLVRLDADVRGGKAELPSDLRACLDR